MCFYCQRCGDSCSHLVKKLSVEQGVMLLLSANFHELLEVRLGPNGEPLGIAEAGYFTSRVSP